MTTAAPKSGTPEAAPITLESLQAALDESIMQNNFVYNCAPEIGTTSMDPVAPLTIDALMEMYQQIEGIAKSIEDRRLYLRDNLHVFIGAPWEVIRAASLLAHKNTLDIHPEEYKRATSLVLSYLEDKSNASLEEHI
jgi:hypothetical protein